MTKVSVVITCYNYDRYLEDCVKSVLDQTYRDFEIIIVDDGSTDGSLGLAHRIADENPDADIKVFGINNTGFPASRNFGIERASGEYIMPLDADDMLTPEYLEKTVAVLDSEPDVSVAYTEYQRIGEVPAGECEHRMGREYDFGELSALGWNFILGCSLFRRDAWEEVGGYKTASEGLDGFYDWEFWISLGEAGRFGRFVNERLYLYRVHGPSRMTVAGAMRSRIRRQIKMLHPRTYAPGLYGLHPALGTAGVLFRCYFRDPVSHFIHRNLPGLHSRLRALLKKG